MLVAGFVVSLLGSLPLGALNLTAFQIAMDKGQTDAFWFSVAVVLVEQMVVSLMFIGAKKLNIKPAYFKWLLPLIVLLLFYLALQNFQLIESGGASLPLATLPQFESAFLLGLLLNSLNPLQFPFWAGWNKTFLEKGWFEKSPYASFTLYLVGIGIGTFLALWIFVSLGDRLVVESATFQNWIYGVLGFIYLALGLYLIFKVLKKTKQKSAAL